MKSIVLILGMLLAGSAAAAPNQTTAMIKTEQLPAKGRGSAHVAYQGRSIDRMVYEFMDQEGIPGMTLAIVQAPYIPRVVGYGLTDIDQRRLASVKTIWPAGPISQGFAAVAVMQLAEQGRLDPADPIAQYLPELPAAWRGITIRHLLQHSAGIPDYRNRTGFDASGSYTPQELLASVASLPLEFASGTDVRQSATHFLLLTLIVEKASGESYRAFVRKNQIERLGLRQTFFREELDAVRQEDLAATGFLHEAFKHDAAYVDPAETTVGYVQRNGRLEPAAQAGNAFRGFSDIWSSAENISHWDIGLAGGILIAEPENRRFIYGPTTLDNGRVVPAMAGWQFYAHPGLMDIKGDVAGHSVYLSRFTDPSELVCVTLMANKEGVDLTRLARRIAAAFDEEKLGTGADEERLCTYESPFGVDQTMDRIEAGLQARKIPVFARFDHGKNAEQVALVMRPARVVVFGSPEVGTQLMQQNPAIAWELPLRIAVWQDASGSVWVAYPQMRTLAATYGLADSPVIENMQHLLERIVHQAANVY